MRKTLLSILAVAATLVACQKNEAPVTQDGPKPVVFSVTNLGTYQFKTPTLALGENGCSNVGIYAADLGANHVEHSVSGTSLTVVNPANTIYWGVGQTASTLFCARYPYADANASGEYVIADDQYAQDTYTYQANLMTAVTTASPSTVGGVQFNFKHPFAKVVINVTNNLGGDGVESVKLTGMKCKATTFNVALENPVAALSAEESDIKDMTAYPAGEGAYNLIVMPQTATPNIVVTTLLGSVYTYSLSAAYEFVAGKTATTSVVLDPIGGSSGAGAKVAPAFSFATVDWTNAASNPAHGDPSSTLGNYWHVIGCVYDDAHKNITVTPAWNYDYPMALGNDGKWTVTINYDEAMSDTGKGLKLRRFTNGIEGDARWTNQFGFQTGTADDWKLASGDTYHNLSNSDSSKNIRLASTGQWTIVLDDDDLTATRLGDVTTATVTE